jgi:hypothetical protein
VPTWLNEGLATALGSAIKWAERQLRDADSLSLAALRRRSAASAATRQLAYATSAMAVRAVLEEAGGFAVANLLHDLGDDVDFDRHSRIAFTPFVDFQTARREMGSTAQNFSCHHGQGTIHRRDVRVGTGRWHRPIQGRHFELKNLLGTGSTTASPSASTTAAAVAPRSAPPDVVCFPPDRSGRDSENGARHHIPVVPFGAGTSLEGTCTPSEAASRSIFER